MRELVIFDWDGTLMDSGARIVAAIQAAIAAADLPSRDAAVIRGIIGLGMHEAVAALFPDAPDTARERLMTVYTETFARAVAEVPATLFAGAAGYTRPSRGRRLSAGGRDRQESRRSAARPGTGRAARAFRDYAYRGRMPVETAPGHGRGNPARMRHGSRLRPGRR